MRAENCLRRLRYAQPLRRLNGLTLGQRLRERARAVRTRAMPWIEAVRFGAGDVVRRDLVARIVEAYDKAGRNG